MKISVILRQLPIPVHAGLHLIIHHILHGLKERHTVQALVLDKNYGSDLTDYFISFHCYGDDAQRSSNQLSPVARYYRTEPEKLAWLQQEIDAQRPDVIIGFGYDLAPYFGLLQGKTPRVLDVVDSEILFLWRQLRTGDLNITTVKHLIAAIAVARQYLAHCDALVTVAEEDTVNIRRISGNKNTFTISNGVDCDFYQPSPSVQKIRGRIIFTGSLNWPPNQAAVSWFLQNCWKQIQQARPDASLVIIGKLLEDDLKREWEQHNNVRVIGFVPDIREHILAAEVSVAPMVSGSGIKNKILEAWALGQAVVATPLAARGLKCGHNENILIADSPEAFAGEVLHLLGNASLQQRLGVSGRQNALAHYSWAGIVSQFEQVISRA
jgi:glycosyltransferase involved in cell wall biosynthesis